MDDYPDYPYTRDYLRAAWTRKGFNTQVYGSITSEINRQVGVIKRQGRQPSLIRLGPTASRLFAYEHGAKEGRVNRGPKSYQGIPIKYRDLKISGVVVV